MQTVSLDKTEVKEGMAAVLGLAKRALYLVDKCLSPFVLNKEYRRSIVPVSFDRYNYL